MEQGKLVRGLQENLTLIIKASNLLAGEETLVPQPTSSQTKNNDLLEGYL